MKKIIWINDNPKKTAGMVEYLFPILWKNKFCAYIIFAGDDYTRDGSLRLNQAYVDQFTNNIRDRFGGFCFSQFYNQCETSMSETAFWEEYKELLPKKTYFVSDTDHDAYPGHEPDYYRKLDHGYKTTKEKIAECIQKIIADGPGDEYYIGLDIRLFISDKKLERETITMQLFYDFFTEKKYNVFLYSAYAIYTDAKPEWAKNFERHHKGFDANTIDIYDMNNLLKPDNGNQDWLDFSEFLSLDRNREKKRIKEKVTA